ncbi:unnamed protein product [Calypogeia fissa]
MAGVENGTPPSTTFCSHCERDVPSPNYDLHSAHCKRNLERCSECREMVPRVRAEEHYNEYHAPTACGRCGAQISRDSLSTHESEKCPRRMVECVYCEFPVEASKLSEHTDICGSRTEMCIPCGKYVRLREKIGHDLQFHGERIDSGPMSRDYVTPRFSTNSRQQPLPNSRGGAPAPVASRHRLMFTFAVTGVAILIGTLVLQRRGPNERTQE